MFPTALLPLRSRLTVMCALLLGVLALLLASGTRISLHLSAAARSTGSGRSDTPDAKTPPQQEGDTLAPRKKKPAIAMAAHRSTKDRVSTPVTSAENQDQPVVELSVGHQKKSDTEKKGQYRQHAAGSDGPPSQCTGKTLYMGHCHVARLRDAHCALSETGRSKDKWKDTTIVSSVGGRRVQLKRRVAIKPEADELCTRYAVGIDNQYLNATVMPSSLAEFSTVILSAWAWDMIHMNSHPKVVFQRVKTTLETLLSLHNQSWGSAARQSNNEGPGVSGRGSTTSSPSSPPKFIVMLPHYHRAPSHKSRAVCQTEVRVKLFSEAVEAAAFQFQRDSGVKVVVLDIYSWTKSLGGATQEQQQEKELGSEDHEKQQVETATTSATSAMPIRGRLWADGGDDHYEQDGGHIRAARWRDVSLALFERGFICGPKMASKLPGREGALLSPQQAPDLVRPPRDTRGYLTRIANGQFSLTKAERGKDDDTSSSSLAALWPSRPTCEGRLHDSESRFFWGNSLGWLSPGQWPWVTESVTTILKRDKYPRSAVLRAQVLNVIQESADAMNREQQRDSSSRRSSFIEARFQLTECLNNVGLDENQTSWNSGADPNPTGNVDYIIWRRRGRETAKNSSSLATASLEGDKNLSTRTRVHKEHKQHKFGLGLQKFKDLLTVTGTSVTSERASKRQILGKTREIPPTVVPTCVCANRTHLLDAVHRALLQQQEQHDGMTKEGVTEDQRQGDEDRRVALEAAIGKHCESVLNVVQD